MGGGEGDSTTTVRWAPYVEAAHIEYLEAIQSYRTWALEWENPGVSDVMRRSPYKNYVDLDFDIAFFGAGFLISSYPSLWDMYGKFMAGLDIEVLFNHEFEDTINGAVVENAINVEADRLEDDLIQDAYPRFETGLRDINSVMSSSFIIGRALMESARTKAIARFSADFKARLLPLVVDRWKTHLDWNKGVIDMYAQLIKFYILTKIDVDNQNFEIKAKNYLWPFTILNFERAAVATLAGPQDTQTDVAGASKGQRMMGAAMTGASAGAMIGSVVPGLGTALGAVIGAGVGLAGGMLGG